MQSRTRRGNVEHRFPWQPRHCLHRHHLAAPPVDIAGDWHRRTLLRRLASARVEDALQQGRFYVLQGSAPAGNNRCRSAEAAEQKFCASLDTYRSVHAATAILNVYSIRSGVHHSVLLLPRRYLCASLPFPDVSDCQPRKLNSDNDTSGPRTHARIKRPSPVRGFVASTEHSHHSTPSPRSDEPKVKSCRSLCGSGRF